MTVSTHVYSAALIGTPNLPLSIKGGSITLDAGSAPHVTADIDVAGPGHWVREGTPAVPPVYSAWAVERTNLFADPEIQTDAAAVWGATSSPTIVLSNTTDGDGTVWKRSTRGGTGQARLIDLKCGTALAASTGFRFLVRVRASAALTVSISTRPNVTATTGSVTFASSIVIPAGESILDYTFTTGATTPTVTAGLVFVATSTVGTWLEITDVLVARTPDVGAGFSGALPDTELARYEWTGLANASPSTYETRTVVTPGVPAAPGGLTWVPDPDTLTALDPRQSKRVSITAVATYSSFGSVTRSFNLGLRDRSQMHADGTVSLSLASDEALLEDYAPIVDDVSLFAYQSNLRDVITYVLNKVDPGAGLWFTPNHNADASVYADATNLITDPAGSGGASIYTGTNATLITADTSWAAAGATSLLLQSPTSTDAFMSIGGGTGAVRLGLRPGSTYVLSATGRVKVAVSGAAHARARRLVAFANVGGIYNEFASPPLPTTVGTATRVSVKFTVPMDATEAFVRAYHGHAAGQVNWDAFRLTEYTGDPTDTAYFDGSTAATAGYSYTWTGPAHASTTQRKALINREPASLLWKAGQNALEFLAPLVQVAGYRLVNDEARRWTLRDENYAATGALSIRHAVNLIDGTDTISRTSGIWFDAAVTTYTWTDASGVQQVRADAYSLTPTYTRLMTFAKNTPYPGPGFSEYAVRRAQGRGREVTATAVADWAANAEQPITVVLEGAPTQIGATQRVVFDLSRDEMTVTTRTTDTPAGAIDLLTGSIGSLVGTIDGL